MSGHSDVIPCPNCGQGAAESSNTKPFPHISIQCNHCGLMIYPKFEYMDLDELNEAREEEGLKPLDKLPEQDKNIW